MFLDTQKQSVTFHPISSAKVDTRKMGYTIIEYVSITSFSSSFLILLFYFSKRKWSFKRHITAFSSFLVHCIKCRRVPTCGWAPFLHIFQRGSTSKNSASNMVIAYNFSTANYFNQYQVNKGASFVYGHHRAKVWARLDDCPLFLGWTWEILIAFCWRQLESTFCIL